MQRTGTTLAGTSSIVTTVVVGTFCPFYGRRPDDVPIRQMTDRLAFNVCAYVDSSKYC